MIIGTDLLEENALLLRAGKKRYHRIVIKEKLIIIQKYL